MPYEVLLAEKMQRNKIVNTLEKLHEKGLKFANYCAQQYKANRLHFDNGCQDDTEAIKLLLEFEAAKQDFMKVNNLVE